MVMAYRSQANWDSVDWSGSDREIAATLSVSYAAVSKRRKKQGHASDYTVDAVLLRGWFEHNRARLSRLNNDDIRIEVFTELDLMDFSVSYWRRQMSPKARAAKARGESIAGV